MATLLNRCVYIYLSSIAVSRCVYPVRLATNRGNNVTANPRKGAKTQQPCHSKGRNPGRWCRCLDTVSSSPLVLVFPSLRPDVFPVSASRMVFRPDRSELTPEALMFVAVGDSDFLPLFLPNPLFFAFFTFYFLLLLPCVAMIVNSELISESLNTEFYQTIMKNKPPDDLLRRIERFYAQTV